MKLLIITDNNIWGGSEILWYQLSKRPGLECVIWSPNGTTWLPPDISRLHVPAPWRRRLRGEREARRLPRDFVCDAVLYVNCFFDDALIAQMLDHTAALRERGIPVTLLTQAVAAGHWIADDTRAHLHRLVDTLSWVFVSESNVRIVEKQLPFIKRRRVIINPPAKILSRLPPALGNHWACVARTHVESKGIDLLIEAALDFPVPIDVYGHGCNHMALQDYAHRLGSPVHFHGKVEDIAAVWLQHPVQILTSRLEGTPLSLLEGGLCGRPAVVTNVGGNAAIVGNDGGIVTVPDVDAIRSAMNEMLARKSEWPRMGDCIHDRCRRIVESDPVGQLHSALLESIAFGK